MYKCKREVRRLDIFRDMSGVLGNSFPLLKKEGWCQEFELVWFAFPYMRYIVLHKVDQENGELHQLSACLHPHPYSVITSSCSSSLSTSTLPSFCTTTQRCSFFFLFSSPFPFFSPVFPMTVDSQFFCRSLKSLTPFCYPDYLNMDFGFLQE